MWLLCLSSELSLPYKYGGEKRKEITGFGLPYAINNENEFIQLNLIVE